jgi:hypothetical protein
VKYCEGKQSCTFKVANETLSSKPPPDPSPGNDKGLIISWSCAAAAPAKAQFAEGRNATIDCR